MRSYAVTYLTDTRRSSPAADEARSTSGTAGSSFFDHSSRHEVTRTAIAHGSPRRNLLRQAMTTTTTITRRQASRRKTGRLRSARKERVNFKTRKTVRGDADGTREPANAPTVVTRMKEKRNAVSRRRSFALFRQRRAGAVVTFARTVSGPPPDYKGAIYETGLFCSVHLASLLYFVFFFSSTYRSLDNVPPFRARLAVDNVLYDSRCVC